MATYEQCVKFESEKPQGVVRLVEANGFYRAYNQSAYLFHQVIAQHKVTRKFVKNINLEVVYIGFPVDKLLERIGGRSHNKTELGYDVELAADELPDEAAYDEWRATVPTDVASRGEVNSLPASGNELYRAVCERIRVYPTVSDLCRISLPQADSRPFARYHAPDAHGESAGSRQQFAWSAVAL